MVADHRLQIQADPAVQVVVKAAVAALVPAQPREELVFNLLNQELLVHLDMDFQAATVNRRLCPTLALPVAEPVPVVVTVLQVDLPQAEPVVHQISQDQQ